MPVPAQLWGVLERLLCVNVETNVGVGVFGCWVGKNDCWSQIPNSAFFTRFVYLQGTLYLSPVPAWFVLLSVLGDALFHRFRSQNNQMNYIE